MTFEEFMREYLDRAPGTIEGKLWINKFVTEHPNYEAIKDMRVDELPDEFIEILNDLVNEYLNNAL